jgi:hypothetical protein
MRLQGPTAVIKAVYIFQLIHDLSLLHLSVGGREGATPSLLKTSHSFIHLIVEGCNFQLTPDLPHPHYIAGGRMQL